MRSAWRAMDAYYEEDERIVGHAADSYHRNDIRQTSRHLVVTAGEQVIADTTSLSFSTSGASPRAGTFAAQTSISQHSPPSTARRSVPTRDWPATTTSAM